MKFALKSLAIAAAFVAAGSANAASETLTAGGSVTDFGYTLSELTGSGTLSFSATLVAALNATRATVTEIAPATANIVTKTNPTTKVVSIATAAAAAPIQTLTGDYTSTTLNVTAVGTLGGAKINAPVANIATTTGFIDITNIYVNLSTKKVFATINGGNGVGLLNNVELWDIVNPIVGSTLFTLPDNVPPEGTVISSTNTLSGLKINQNALNIFIQATGLTANGISALNKVTDYGSITSNISVRVTPSIPEPSTYALMGVGLLGVSLVARRRAAK